MPNDGAYSVVIEDTPVYARGVGPDNHTVKEKRWGSKAEAGTVEELEREIAREAEWGAMAWHSCLSLDSYWCSRLTGVIRMLTNNSDLIHLRMTDEPMSSSQTRIITI